MRYGVRSLAQTSLLASAVLSWIAVGGGLPVQAANTTGLGLKREYPETVVQAYVDACGSEALPHIPQPIMHEICVCTIEEFQNAFSLQEFRAIGQAIREERDVPPAMYQIMSDCARQAMMQIDV
jgi:hypothetical protein